MKILKGIGVAAVFLIGILIIGGVIYGRIAEFVGPHRPWYAHWWIFGPFVAISAIGAWWESRKG